VRITYLSAQGAAGTMHADFEFRNVGPRTCRVHGFVGLALYDASGAKMPTGVQRQAQEAGAGPNDIPTVTLAPGGVAGYHMSWGHIPSGPQPCPIAERLHVTPPDELDFVVVSAHPRDGNSPIDPCGDVTVYPIRPSP